MAKVTSLPERDDRPALTMRQRKILEHIRSTVETRATRRASARSGTPWDWPASAACPTSC